MYHFAVIALAAFSIAAAAPAAASAQEFTVKVKTSDLNLQTEQGAKTAVDRIIREARRACTPEVEVGTRIPHVDEVCLSDISNRLVQRLNAPMVRAAYDARKATAGQG